MNTETSKYSNLINEDRIRRSIRRLFENDVNEILSELFQNSQRAMAKTVAITTDDESGMVTYHDDGVGLDGLDGFLTLLRIAESGFKENPTIEAQDPMGLGIHSILAHTQVKQVTFTSGTTQVSIDTERWWSDGDYYRSWADRARTLETEVPGLRIQIGCDPVFAEAAAFLLAKNKKRWEVFRNGNAYVSQPYGDPARGYDGMLAITLNGEPVDTTLPQGRAVTRPFWEGEYMGCKLSIGRKDSHSACGSINWYGQEICWNIGDNSNSHNHGFVTRLVVREGRPVNPKAPTRKGIIQDEALATLNKFVLDRIFEFGCDRKNRVDVGWVRDMYLLDRDRANAECPYFLASEYLHPDDYSCYFERGNGGSSSDMKPDYKTEAKMFTYGENEPTLIEKNVTILWADGNEEERDHGCSTFASDVVTLFSLTHGNRNRLRIGKIVWRPGDPIVKHSIFYGNGEFAVRYPDTESLDELKWRDASDNVIAFDSGDNEDITQSWVNAVCGAADLDTFIGSNVPWMPFVHYDDYSEHGSHEEQEDRYDDTLKGILRAQYGDAIRPDWTWEGLPRACGWGYGVHITNVAIEYTEGDYPRQKAIVVTNDKGETKRLLTI